jgi:MFS transporter, MCT family, solute carrier family 16 (monocarboxylic acid transporters), member 10
LLYYTGEYIYLFDQHFHRLRVNNNKPSPSLHRFTSGVFTGQLPIPVMRLGPIQDVGKRIGYSSTIMALGVLCGTPISGAIIRRSGSDAIAGYKNAGWWSGSVVLVGVFTMLVARWLKLGGLRGRF